jgi:hypothetical protein
MFDIQQQPLLEFIHLNADGSELTQIHSTTEQRNSNCLLSTTLTAGMMPRAMAKA